MSQQALIAAAGLLAIGAWIYTRQDSAGDSGDYGGGYSLPEDAGELEFLGSADEILTSATQDAAQFVDKITMGTFKLSNMAAVTDADLNNANVRALLRVIRRGEGTSDEAGYSRLFGGAQFSGFADHPRQKVTRSGLTSTAAGAYQFLSSTWDETARLMGLGDFSPANQDRAAVGRIAARGALEDAKAGHFDAAIQKIGKEWASMPGSPYGQPVISLQTARNVYADNGGTTA